MIHIMIILYFCIICNVVVHCFPSSDSPLMVRPSLTLPSSPSCTITLVTGAFSYYNAVFSQELVIPDECLQSKLIRYYIYREIYLF